MRGSRVRLRKRWIRLRAIDTSRKMDPMQLLEFRSKFVTLHIEMYRRRVANARIGWRVGGDVRLGPPRHSPLPQRGMRCLVLNRSVEVISIAELTDDQ